MQDRELHDLSQQIEQWMASLLAGKISLVDELEKPQFIRRRSATTVLEARIRYEIAMAEWAEWAVTQFTGNSPATPETKPEEA